jgi:hypothetical protein
MHASRRLIVWAAGDLTMRNGVLLGRSQRLEESCQSEIYELIDKYFALPTQEVPRGWAEVKINLRRKLLILHPLIARYMYVEVIEVKKISP